MVLAICNRLMLINISMAFHEDILNGFQVTELQSGQSGWHCMRFHQDLLNCFQDIVPKRFCRKLLFYKVQRDIAKTYKEELLFLCSARCLMIFCMKFHQNILNGFRYRADTILQQKLLLANFKGA